MKIKHLLFPLLSLSSTLALESTNAPFVEKEFGFYLSNITYEEPSLMKESGTMRGLRYAWAYHHDWVTQFDASFSEGDIDYEGSGSSSDIYDYIYEIRASFGQDFYINQLRITPSIGYGYRYLNDDSTWHLTSIGALGYKREQEYFYSPIALEFRSYTNAAWEIGGVLEYDYFWKGINHSYPGYIQPAYEDLKFDQEDGKGYRVSVRFSKKRTGIFSKITIEPFYHYWHIQTSNIVINSSGNWREPENNSKEVGINFMLAF